MPDYGELWEIVTKAGKLHSDLMPAALNCIEHRFQDGDEAWQSRMTAIALFLENQRIEPGNDAVEQAVKQQMQVNQAEDTEGLRKILRKDLQKKAEKEWISAAWRMAIRNARPRNDLSRLFELLNYHADIASHLKDDASDFSGVFPNDASLTVPQLREVFEKFRHFRVWLDTDTSVVGRYRMFFPVVENLEDSDEGWLVVAKVYAIRCSEESLQNAPEVFRTTLQKEVFRADPPEEGSRLLVAPWTSYVPIDDKAGSLTRLRKDLHPAIKSVEGQLKTCGSADDLVYLLELQPLEPKDVPRGLPEFRNCGAAVCSVVSAGKLSAKRFSVAGESIGLGIFLATVAAITRYSFRTCLATGKLVDKHDGTFKIGGIGGVTGKLKVITDFLDCVENRNAFNVLFPKENSKVGTKRIADRLEGILHLVPDSMNEALTAERLARIFTDGFDEWREKLRIAAKGDADHKAATDEDAPKGEGYSQLFEKGYTAVEAADDDMSRLSGNEPFLNSDKVEYEQSLKELKTVFTAAPDPERKLCLSVGVPFNEDPRAVSDWLCYKICQDAWSGHLSRENLADVPVVVPVYLDILDGKCVEEDGSIDIARLIHRSLKDGPRLRLEQEEPFGVSIPIDTVRNALARPGKLILIVSDKKSLELSFTADPMTPNTRAEVWFRLAELADSGLAGVVMVCSDEHYQRMVESQRAPAGV